MISKQVRFAIGTTYNYLNGSLKWESPFGHLIPRGSFYKSRGDASFCCIGVTIPKIKFFVLLPFSKELRQQILNQEVWINSLEFIALFIAYIAFLVEYNLRLDEFPPYLVLRLWGNNMSTNK